MRLIIAGTRSLKVDAKFLATLVGVVELNMESVTEIVSGLGGNVDKAGELFAFSKGIPLTPFPAKWDLHGKSAGPIRNREMACYADALLLVWNGASRGSLNMRQEMLALKKPVYETIIRNYL